MTAILLAAGVGKRLGEAFGDTPKCLVPVGGRPMLARLVDGLASVGVRRVVIVTGFGDDQVRDAIGGGPEGIDLRYVFNPRFHEGAILSLWAARAHLGGSVLIMDADVVCATSMLRRLLESPHANCFLLDASVESTGEEQMLLVRDGWVRDIVRGGRAGYELQGESVGFLKLSGDAARRLRAFLERRLEAGETDIEHEEVYPDLLRSVEVGYERVDGDPWIEVDFPEDVERAEREILPRIEPA